MNDQNNLKAVIVARIEAIAAAEKITKAELGHVSREMLLYVPDSDDIDVVNRLLGVLTPMNRATAILFFKHFLPWEVEEDAKGEFSRFGKRIKKEKQLERKLLAITEFLADENNNIWTWASANVTLDYTQKDFAAMVTKAVTQALKGEKKDNGETPPLSMTDVIGAVLRGGVQVTTLLAYAEAIEAEMKEQTDQLMAEAA